MIDVGGAGGVTSGGGGVARPACAISRGELRISAACSESSTSRPRRSVLDQSCSASGLSAAGAGS